MKGMKEILTRYYAERRHYFQHNHLAEGSLLKVNLLEEEIPKNKKFYFQISKPTEGGYLSGEIYFMVKLNRV